MDMICPSCILNCQSSNASDSYHVAQYLVPITAILSTPPTTNKIAIAVNILCVAIVLGIVLILFMPFIVIFSLYDPQWSRTGLNIQWFIIIINVMFHVCSLQIFGYYSLSIIICGLIYICVKEFAFIRSYLVVNFSTSVENYQYPFVVMTEYLLCFIMIFITFIIDYHHSTGGMTPVTLLFFVMYIFPNIPFSSLILDHLYFMWSRQSKAYQFIFKYQSDIVAQENHVDKLYYVLHIGYHTKQITHLFDDMFDERRHLLNQDTEGTHDSNSMQCFMQVTICIYTVRYKAKNGNEF
eukprot:525406_1